MKLLDAMQQALQGKAVEGFALKFPPPVATLIGFELVTVEHGTAMVRLEARRDKHANPMGTVHGGILCDLADAAMGIACASLLDQGETFTTLELKINYLRPVFDAQLEARGRVVHGGRTMVYLECDVVSLPGEKLIARSSSTCLILRGEQAKGR